MLERAGLTIDDIDIFEINEAFAVVVREVPARARTSTATRSTSTVAPWRSAIPIGATGAVLIGTALDELERTDGQFALITMCAGGGMAPGDHHRTRLEDS